MHIALSHLLVAVVLVLASFDWGAFGYLLQPFVGIVTLGLAGVIAHAIKTPKDHERASEIALVARDIAVGVVAETGGAPWAKILQQVINQLSDSIPNAPAAVIARAAKAALIQAGAAVSK